MDLTYQNNKGLYAFVLAFMVILAVFLPGTSSYAASAPAPTSEFKTATIKFKTYATTKSEQYAGGANPYGFVNNSITMNSSEDAKKVTSIRVYNATTQKDITSNFFIDYSQNREARVFVKTTPGQQNVLVNQGEEIQITYIFSQMMPVSSYYEMFYSNSYNIISSSFLKTVPPVNVKVPVEVQKVKDLPATLGKVAGIATLAGCLILGTLLAVGSVRRLISLFIR